MDQFVHVVRPRYAEVDLQGVVFNAHWLTYFAVSDTDATVAKADSLGGKITVPATDIPGVGRFAILQDPQGAHFAVIKLPMA